MGRYKGWSPKKSKNFFSISELKLRHSLIETNFFEVTKISTDFYQCSLFFVQLKKIDFLGRLFLAIRWAVSFFFISVSGLLFCMALRFILIRRNQIPNNGNNIMHEIYRVIAWRAPCDNCYIFFMGSKYDFFGSVVFESVKITMNYVLIRIQK